MRHCQLALFLLLSFACSSNLLAQSTQKGVAYQYNGEKPRTGLKGVLIQCDDASNNNILTASNGAFTLTLPTLKAGDPLRNVRISKKGMIVMNREAIAEWSVRKEPLVVVLRDEEEFNAEKARLEKVTKEAAQRIYEAKKAELEKEVMAGSITRKERAEKLAALQSAVESFRKQSQTYSDFLAGIDLREVSAPVRDAIELVTEGKPEAAAFILEEENFPEKINDNTADDKTRKQNILGVRLLMAVYRLSLDWSHYDNLLETVSLYLDDVVEVQIENGNHLIEKGSYAKGIDILENALVKIDSIVKPNWYLSAKNWLAEAYATTGNNEQAIRVCEEALSFMDSLEEDAMEESYTLISRASFLVLQLTSMNALRMDTEEITRKTLTAARRAARSDYALEGTSLLIVALGTKTLTLLQQNRKEEAAALKKELEEIFDNPPDGFVHNASTLSTRFLLTFGDKEESERVLRENIRICWQLAKETPWKFEPLAAQMEYNLAQILIASTPKGKRNHEIEEILDESIDILRRYSELSPEFHSMQLASSLYTLSFYLSSITLFILSSISTSLLTCIVFIPILDAPIQLLILSSKNSNSLGLILYLSSIYS